MWHFVAGPVYLSILKECTAFILKCQVVQEQSTHDKRRRCMCTVWVVSGWLKRLMVTPCLCIFHLSYVSAFKTLGTTHLTQHHIQGDPSPYKRVYKNLWSCRQMVLWSSVLYCRVIVLSVYKPSIDSPQGFQNYLFQKERRRKNHSTMKYFIQVK